MDRLSAVTSSEAPRVCTASAAGFLPMARRTFLTQAGLAAGGLVLFGCQGLPDDGPQPEPSRAGFFSDGTDFVN